MGSWTDLGTAAQLTRMGQWGASSEPLMCLLPAGTHSSVRSWLSVQHCRGLCPFRALSTRLLFQMKISDRIWKASRPPSSWSSVVGPGLGSACRRTSLSSVATSGGHQHLQTGARWPAMPPPPRHTAAEASFSLTRPLTALHVPVCRSDTAGPALLMQEFGSGHLHSYTACPITYCSSRPRTLSSGVWGFPRVPRLVPSARGWPLPGHTFGLVSPSCGGCGSCSDRLSEDARGLESGPALSPVSSSWA